MRHRVAELARFGLVGASSALLYFAIYAGLVLLATPYVLASIAAFLVSAASGYVLHDRFTFKTRNASVENLAGWFALQGSLVVFNLLALSALVHGAGLDEILAQAIVLPLLPLMSYAASRRLVFTRR